MPKDLPEDDSPLAPRKDRAEKLRKRRQKMKQHGKNLARIYRDAVEKRKRQLPRHG
ncbi:MAG: hypothetical protein N2506_05890 [Dehalococcoidales bacterium]|nr:hypothetical protein [Dehalococcoidales bacterium]